MYQVTGIITILWVVRLNGPHILIHHWFVEYNSDVSQIYWNHRNVGRGRIIRNWCDGHRLFQLQWWDGESLGKVPPELPYPLRHFVWTRWQFGAFESGHNSSLYSRRRHARFKQRDEHSDERVGRHEVVFRRTEWERQHGGIGKACGNWAVRCQ